MKLKGIISLVIFYLSLKGQDIGKIFQRLSRSYSDIQDVSCEVETKIHLPESTVTIKSRIWVKGKEYYRVKSLTGQPMEFSKAGDKIYMKMGNQVQKINLKDIRENSRIKNKIKQTENPLKFQTQDYLKTHNIRLISSQQNILRFELIPKKDTFIYSKMEMSVDTLENTIKELKIYTGTGIQRVVFEYQENNGKKFLKKIRMLMHNGMFVEMDYRNYRVNQGLSDKFFEIK